MNQGVIAQFRSGAPMRMPKDRMVLVTTIGRRTGRPHTTPMMFLTVSDEAGEHLVVAGSNSGSDHEPDWVRNIRASGAVTVEIGDGRTGPDGAPAHAQVVDDTTREQWWPQVIAANPVWGAHQQGLPRQIPLVEITLDR